MQFKKFSLNERSKNMTTPHFRTLISRSPLWCGFLLIALALACFALLPKAQAQLSPPPDGDYRGRNTAEGAAALFNLTSGTYNTAIGWLSLNNVETGNFNTAVGAATLLANTADQNTATGAGALISNFTGTANTANGAFALYYNNADSNTAIGDTALAYNTTGSQNTALGQGAGFNQTIGSGNVYIGASVLGVAAESDHTYIRNINTTSVSGGGTDTVTVNLSTGLLGHLSSSRRYKEDIKPMDKTSEALYRLKPVTYRYKKEIDQSQLLDCGLIAEDVAEIDPNLTVCNRDGQIESVRYTAVNAMLLNEFLKEHKKVEKQEATITRLTNDFQTVSTQQRNEIQLLSAQLKEQAAQIQKVSAQLEASKPAPQVVNNP